MFTHFDLLFKSIVSIHKGTSKQMKLETYIERFEKALCQELDESEIKKIQTILIQLKPNDKKPKTTSGYDLFRKHHCAVLKSSGSSGKGKTNFTNLASEWNALSHNERDVWRRKAIELVCQSIICDDPMEENQPGLENMDQLVTSSFSDID